MPSTPWRTSTWCALLLTLALATLLIHGYHPLAEDGGLYVAGVQFTLDPSLFPGDTAFVSEHLRFSIFAPVLAALVHLTHLPLPWTLLLVDFAALTLTFYAARQLLRRCIASEPAQLAALALLASWATLPIAGTSLLLLDPYVTARSLSTPLSLLALAFALDDWPIRPPHPQPIRMPDPSPIRTPQPIGVPQPIGIAQPIGVPHPRRGLIATGWGALFHTCTTSPAACLLTLLLAALFHPLMAAYALAFVLCLRATRLRRPPLAFALLTVLALTVAAVLSARAPAESPALIAAALTRYYWFLSQWHWYELLGLAGPILVLAALLRWPRQAHNPHTRNRSSLIHAAIALGLIATLIALLFAHETSPTHLVARLQPLRAFLPIYAVMTLLLGASLTQALLHARSLSPAAATRATLAALPCATLLTLAAIMFFVQRSTFPASPHLELPWPNSPTAANPNPHQNQWSSAFLWARANTPRDALFALDPHYITTPGEDAQTFRATAQRSALPDFSKDGGEASITPSLANLWQQSVSAQLNLSSLPDALRDARLLPLGVTWMLLRSAAATAHPCPYDNGTVKLCRLTP